MTWLFSKYGNGKYNEGKNTVNECSDTVENTVVI